MEEQVYLQLQPHIETIAAIMRIHSHIFFISVQINITFFKQCVTLCELFVKLNNRNTIYYKDVQQAYIKLQNVQNMLHCLRTIL